MSRRTILAVVAVVVIVIVLTLVLVFVPLESTLFAQAAPTESCRGVLSPCSTLIAEFTIGDSRYSILSGSWVSNSTGGDVVVTINNGPSSEGCVLCSNLLYSSESSTLPAGSFDVSGFGPFHISVSQVGNSDQTTTVQGTLDSAVF